jgi:pullulanase
MKPFLFVGRIGLWRCAIAAAPACGRLGNGQRDCFNSLDKLPAQVHDFGMSTRCRWPYSFPWWLSVFRLALVFLVVLDSCEIAEPSPMKTGFNSYYYPADDLGAVYRPQMTILKLWAPTALAVSLKLFDSAESSNFQLIPLEVDKNGVWSVTLGGNQDGKYYLYQVTLPGSGTDKPVVNEVNDPYAQGCSANSGRTLIYDPAKTNPEGWEHDHFVTLKNNTDAILYEAHVRDFTINANAGATPDNRGKYLGMVETGTRSPGGLKTGLDHLSELGITHIHLLPVFDYAGGDERQRSDDYTWYDWGYDPVLYNTPEGSYASYPDGTVRQQEFKRMVQALHRRQIGVVMDVVFNHTANTGDERFSIFDKIYPGYYYRTDASGRYANATGCGNEFASERPMARNFIVNSIRYWMKEYHVDGFRFDLMGILDRETMLQVYSEAKLINPSVIIYGEGWNMEQVLPAKMMMTQFNVQGSGIAAFNDGIRDNIKGDFANHGACGFVQGAPPAYGGMGRFCLNIKGQSTGRDQTDIPVFSPNETINYDSVHDDLCLWDKLQVSAASVPEISRIRMDQLAAGIILTSQGVPLIHAGDEFLRSKKLDSNSYNNNDPQVNPVNWSLKDTHADVFSFYRGLIALRKAHPAFRMSDRAAVNASLDFATHMPENLVAYVIRNHANRDSWKNILVIYNGSDRSRDLAIQGDWKIVANARQAGVDDLDSTIDRIHVEAYSLVVAHTDGDYQFNE